MRKRYPSYKFSGIDWLGRIPKDWIVRKLKYNTYIKARVGWHGLNSEEFGFEGIHCVTGADFFKGKVDWAKCYRIGEERYNEDPYIQLKEADLLITKDGTIGKTAIANNIPGRATLNSGIFVVRPERDYTTTYLYWALQSSLFTEFVNYNAKGTTINHLYQDAFSNMPLLIPSLPEQHAIASYLDRKIAQIDETIQKKKRLIELLYEERAALINGAVTRGLDESVPLKPSGASWLGDIPKHWEFLKLKYTTALLKDGTHLPPPRTEKGYPLLSVRNLDNKGYIRFLEDDSKVSKEDFQLLTKSFQIQENDLLLAIVGATMGKVSLVPAMEPFAIQRSLAVIRVNRAVVRHDFLFYSLQSWYFQSLLWNTTGFSAQPGIYLGSIANFSIPIPPLEEQKYIVDVVEEMLSKTDLTISLIGKELILLQEYRTALINEVVTGKVCVV